MDAALYGVSVVIGLLCVLMDNTGMWPGAAPLPSGSPGKSEDLCPCLKWVVAHQRQGVLLRDESWDVSALFWEVPSLSFGESCKSAGQVSSKGQSHPCISIQGSGSQSAGKASGSTCCKVGGVESCMYEPGVMSGSLHKVAWAPEDGGLRSSQDVQLGRVCHSSFSCWAPHGHK